ncbi:MAG: hypothetical protein K9K32_03630 [Halanaerobiales bacterium]|nr:hypothetical protein [Halanaerobiales bacterium]
MKINKSLAMFLILIFLFTYLGSSRAQDDFSFNEQVFRAENLLFLEVSLSGMKLTEEFISSYLTENLTFVPFGQLMNYLQLSFNVDLDNLTIEGFIWSRNENYLLDLNREIAIANEVEVPFIRENVVVYQNDIYLNIQFISDWLPINISVNPYTATLNVTSEKPLPLKAKLERENRWERLRDLESKEKPEYDLKENPYTFISGPFVDHRITFSYDDNSEISGNQSTKITGDLLYMSGRLFISGTVDDPISEINAQLGRRSPEPNLLGPLKAHEVWLGDISQPNISDITVRESVKGFFISSYPYLSPNRFYTHTFEGELPENWEVELYDNGILVDFQRSNQEGKYLFENIPLNYGFNEFTLVLYDQYGQRYEESQVFRIDSSLVPPGQNRYRVDLGQTDQGDLRGIFNYSRGLNENLTFVTNLVSLADQDEVDNYAKIGLRGALDGYFLEGTYFQEINGGRGGEIGFYTELKKTHLSFKNAFFSDYSSEIIPADLIRRTNINLWHSFDIPVVSSLGTRLELIQKAYDNNDITTDINNYLSTYYKGYSFRNTINMNFDNENKNGSGNLWIYKNLNKIWIRGEFGYQLFPLKTEYLAAEISGQIDDIHGYNFRINRDLVDGETSYLAGISRNVDNYQLDLNGSYAEQQDWQISLGISTNYGRSDRTNQFEAGTESRYGAVSVKTYLDLGDRIKPLEGIGYLINGKTISKRTNQNGVAFIPNLLTDRRTDITINQETLPDPFMVVKPEGVSFIPRAGQTFEVSLPVVLTSEIGGHVYLQSDQGIRALKGVEIQLVDQENNLIKKTFTAFDGYYYFSEVIPGDYQLKISKEFANKLSVKNPAVININLPPKGGYFEGFDFELNR